MFVISILDGENGHCFSIHPISITNVEPLGLYGTNACVRCCDSHDDYKYNSIQSCVFN